MRDHTRWFAALTAAAPRVDQGLLRVLAVTLANPATPVDLLLSIADALIQVATVATLEGRMRDAAEIDGLAVRVAGEAARPRPGFL